MVSTSSNSPVVFRNPQRVTKLNRCRPAWTTGPRDRSQLTLRDHAVQLPGCGADVDVPGLHQVTPDGTPVLGASCDDNLYLNMGHGTLGLTNACGSGKPSRMPFLDGSPRFP